VTSEKTQTELHLSVIAASFPRKRESIVSGSASTPGGARMGGRELRKADRRRL